jgi:hypothetical protein
MIVLISKKKKGESSISAKDKQSYRFFRLMSVDFSRPSPFAKSYHHQ